MREQFNSSFYMQWKEVCGSLTPSVWQRSQRVKFLILCGWSLILLLQDETEENIMVYGVYIFKYARVWFPHPDDESLVELLHGSLQLTALVLPLLVVPHRLRRGPLPRGGSAKVVHKIHPARRVHTPLPATREKSIWGQKYNICINISNNTE